MSTKNYLAMYATEKTPMFQMGGAMEGGAQDQAQDQAAAAPQGAPDVEGMLQQYAQSKDPQLAVQICDTLVAMMAQGQEGAPAPSMSHGGRMNYTTPVFKKGGRLL
jgi:hypothetical protein